jgi:hypothetical protein
MYGNFAHFMVISDMFRDEKVLVSLPVNKKMFRAKKKSVCHEGAATKENSESET